MVSKPLFTELDHIGIVVRDINKAIEFYQSLGIGPFEKSGTPGKDKTMYGKPIIAGKSEIRMGRMGNVGVQLFQPIEGPAISKEFLDKFGEGINHVAYKVDNIVNVTAEMEKRGYSVIFTSTYIDGGGEIYVDTGNNFAIQLFQPPK